MLKNIIKLEDYYTIPKIVHKNEEKPRMLGGEEMI